VQGEGAGTAATAGAVLTRHCGECHGSGKDAKEPLDIANVQRLALDRKWVRPGLPDQSVLYAMMASGAMPPFSSEREKKGLLPSGEEIAQVRNWIAGLEPAGARQRTAEPSESADAHLQISLRTPAARAGQPLTVIARSRKRCHLTIVNVEPDGIATVIFPNDFQRENLVEPGQVVRIPPEKGAYRLKFKRPGRETMVGICNDTDHPVDGIEHDFDRLRFTVLGNWSEFLRNNLGHEAARMRHAKASRPRYRRVRQRIKWRGRWRWRWRRETIRATARPFAWPVPQARTAISINVRK
jgi:mono/diheme cytochrome c family protein